MGKRFARVLLASLASCLVWAGLASPARASNEVFLSTTLAASEATYVLQFDLTVGGRLAQLHVTLSSGSLPATPQMGMLLIGDNSTHDSRDDSRRDSGDDSEEDSVIADATITSGGSATAIIAFRARKVKPGTRVRVELFGVTNPPAGSHTVSVTALRKSGTPLEEISLGFSTFDVGDITAIIAGEGLTGGGGGGEVTLGIATGGITSTMIKDATVSAGDVNPAQIQLRVTGTCPAGAIQAVNQDGSVTCQSASAGVTAVTASAPLFSSGGATPDISLPHVIIGTANTAIGQGALPGNTGNDNTASGVNALQNNATGSDNTATGAAALQSNTTGFGNTATGADALRSNTTGGSNTASGDNALRLNTTGGGNTASGANALFSNTRGNRNTASGVDALGRNTTGNDNTASGLDALRSNTTGGSNTASGVSALQSNTTGSSNTASGGAALLFNTTGGENTASGANALSRNTTGHFNTASGATALFSNTTGSSNTASGVDALVSNTTGSNNTAIGRGANVAAGDLTNATAIGAGAIVNASNKIRLGNTAVTNVETSATITALAFNATSDATKKEHFLPVDGEGVLQKIQGLTLTSWNFIGQDPQQFRHYGLMAQEFFAAFGSDGIGTIGTPTTINSGDLAGILMSAVQALGKRTSEQRAAIETLKAENAALKARVEALQKGSLAQEALAQR